MEKTLSGIDNFEIRWQAFQLFEDKKTNRTQLIFEAEKAKNQPLEEFLFEYESYYILPRYYINEIDFADWLSPSEGNKRIIDEPGGEINLLITAFNLGDYAWLKIMHHRFLGKQINREFLKALNFYKEENFDNIIAEENEDVQLYGCGCGDRLCGYIPMKTIRKEEMLIWRLYPGWCDRDLIFVYKDYAKEFDELMQVAENRQKGIKQDWSLHKFRKKGSRIVTVSGSEKWSDELNLIIHKIL